MRRRTSVRTLPKSRKPAAEGSLRQVGDGHWEIRIKRELRSPNRNGFAWIRRREREEWNRALIAAVAGFAGVTTNAGVQMVKRSISLFVVPGVKERRRVTITRLAPSKRRFLLDDDNLAYAAKQLVDELKVAGMLYEDRRDYCERPLPTQEVSPDGEFWVVIAIQRLGVGPAATTNTPPPAVAGGLLP